MLRYKASAYALLAVYEIAREHKGVSNPPGCRAADISKKYKLPKAYTAKVLSQLAACGLLHSDRGPHGGYRLNKPPEKVTLHDVFEGVGGLATDKMIVTQVYTLPKSVDECLKKARADTVVVLRNLFKKTHLSDLMGGRR